MISQAWLIAWLSPATARDSTDTADSCPTRPCHTVTTPSLPYATDTRTIAALRHSLTHARTGPGVRADRL